MSIDLGNSPTPGNEATAEQKEQIRAALGLNNFVDKDTAQTLTNKTLNNVNITGTTFGQLDLHNQLPNLNTSALTRSALLSEMCQHFLTPISWNTPVKSATGSFVESAGLAVRLQTSHGAQAGDYSYVRGFYPTAHNNGSGTYTRMNGSVFSVLLDVYANSVTANAADTSEFRFLYGIPDISTATGALPVVDQLNVLGGGRVLSGGSVATSGSFGIFFRANKKVVIKIHNGTNIQTSDVFTLPNTNGLGIGWCHRFMIVWVNNTVKLYYKSWAVQTGGIPNTPPRWTLLGSLAVDSGVATPTVFHGDEFIIANAVTTNRTATGASPNLWINGAYTAPFDSSPLVL